MFLVLSFAGTSPAAAETRLASLESHASISPVLEMSLSQNVQSELKFGNIATSAFAPMTSSPQDISIVIRSNSGSKYLLSQSISGPLENSQGDQIALDNLQFRSSSQASTGTAVAAFTSVSPTPQTIFTSDEQGTGDTILVAYQLTIPPSQAPGDYAALVTYTVSSI